MKLISVTAFSHTSMYLHDGHMNANMLPAANTGTTPFGGNLDNSMGNPTSESSEALQYFDVGHTRFPAGQDKAMFSETGIIVEGDIPEFVRNFLEYAQVEGISVNLVVPVESLEEFDGPSKQQILADLPLFAKIIDTEFPGVVTGYELGNEYWFGRTPGDASREIEYGKAAAEAAIAIDFGLRDESNAEIIIQASGNLAATYENNLTMANEAIREAFSSIEGSQDIVDGVVRNFYWRDRGADGFDNSTGIFQEDRGLAENLHDENGSGWDEWVGKDLTTYVGEYNITNRISFGTDPIDLGIHGASMMLEHFTNMIEADVDVAFAWPFIHSTRNAFIHRHEDIEVTEVNDFEIITNSTRGAMFDLLNKTVLSHELVELEWTGSEFMEITGFQNMNAISSEDPVTAYDTTIFLSSRTDELMNFQVDLSMLLSGYTNAAGISIFYAEDNDHQRDAIVTELNDFDLNMDGIFDLVLRPYEVVQVTFRHGYDLLPTGELSFTEMDDNVLASSDSATYLLLSGNDTLQAGHGADIVDGGDGDDLIFGLSGNDSIIGGGASDTIFGGEGNDTVIGGWGRDSLDGGDGNDWISAGTMNDTVYGGAGSDSLFGGSGKDLIIGGSGRDQMDGGTDSDRLFGGVGDDVLNGGEGNDYLNGEVGNDVVRGGEGDDYLFGGNGNDRLFGDTGSDTIVAGRGDDLVRAGTGSDIVRAGTGNDTIYGGSGFDFLRGQEGDDWLSGGYNADRFIFESDHGNDTVSDFDFEIRAEKIVFSGVVGLTEFNDLFGRLEDTTEGVIIHTSDSSSVFLEGVMSTDLGASDFAFL